MTRLKTMITLITSFYDNIDRTNIDRKYLENFLNLSQISLKRFILTCDLYNTQLERFVYDQIKSYEPLRNG